jgi:hypothetical protein
VEESPAKYITIPINLSFKPTGVGEAVDSMVKEEELKSINPTYDGEKIKYKSYNNGGYTVNFRFYNENSNSFVSDYSAAGFVFPEDLTKNNFNRSYFRLYFYDVNEPQNRNLLFFEEIDAYGTQQPIVDLKKIYWLRMDELFKTSLQNRTVYVIARFFNAKTGKIHDFINLPISTTTPIDIQQFSGNPDWWSSPIEIINPKKYNNGIISEKDNNRESY